MHKMDKVFVEDKWALTSSLIGGAIGTILIVLNVSLMAVDHAIVITTASSMAMGMIGGIVGGATASMMTGFAVHIDRVLVVGIALGIGPINGLLSGGSLGILLGLAHDALPAAQRFIA